MTSPSATVALSAHLAVLSSISFGGFPSVLPDVHSFVVANGRVTDQEFANFFAVSQFVPGPNLILMMSFIGLKVGGIPGAIAAVPALEEIGARHGSLSLLSQDTPGCCVNWCEVPGWDFQIIDPRHHSKLR